MELLPLHKTYNWGSFFTQKKCLHRDLFCLFIRYTLMYKHSELFLKLERHFRSYRKRTILMYFLSFKSSKLETPFRVFPLATLCKWKQVTNDWCNVTRNDQTTLLLIHKLCNPMLSFKCFFLKMCVFVSTSFVNTYFLTAHICSNTRPGCIFEQGLAEEPGCAW